MSLRFTPGLLSSGSFLGCAGQEKMYSHMLVPSTVISSEYITSSNPPWWPWCVHGTYLLICWKLNKRSTWLLCEGCFLYFDFFAFEHMFGCRHSCTCVWRVISCQAFTWVLETKPGSLCLRVLQCEPSLQAPAWFLTPPWFSVDPCFSLLWLHDSEEEFGFVHWFWPSVLEVLSVYSVHTALLLTRGEAAVLCEPGRILLTSWKLGSKERVKGRDLGQQKLTSKSLRHTISNN